MSSNWGENFKISIFGESHGKGIGVVVDGLPSGIPIDIQKIETMMARRAPGKDKCSTKRKEPDKVEILSGLYNNHTTGTPIGGIIFNQDTRSSDYKNIPIRPSHGDYPGAIRYKGYNDPRGGGHFSGRLTAPLVFAGSIAKQALSLFDITVGAKIKRIYNTEDNIQEKVTSTIMAQIIEKIFPVFDDKQGNIMRDEIEKARLDEDSVGGIVDCYAFNVPVGVGSPIFGGLENKISSIVFGIPAVRGIEFGTGFDAVSLKGSQHNDPYILGENGEIMTSSNHHGGIIGGISSGMPICLSVAFKPTPSISQIQTSVDLMENIETTVKINGRHDPCVVPRAVPCVEAAVAIAILDSMLEGGNVNVTWPI